MDHIKQKRPRHPIIHNRGCPQQRTLNQVNIGALFYERFLVTKSSELRGLEFSGNRKLVAHFIRTLEAVFEEREIPSKYKIGIAIFCLKEEALKWFKSTTIKTTDLWETFSYKLMSEYSLN